MKRSITNKLLAATTSGFVPKPLYYEEYEECESNSIKNKVSAWIQSNNFEEVTEYNNTIDNMNPSTSVKCENIVPSNNSYQNTGEPSSKTTLVVNNLITEQDILTLENMKPYVDYKCLQNDNQESNYFDCVIYDADIPTNTSNQFSSDNIATNTVLDSANKNLNNVQNLIVVPPLRITTVKLEPGLEDLFNDPEYLDNIETVDGERKKKKSNKRYINKVNRNKINPNIAVECKHKDILKPFCEVSAINFECIKKFKHNLCSFESKIDQDKYLLSMMTVQKPSRTNRRKKETKNKYLARNIVKYYIPSIRGKIRVCSFAFRSITSIKRKRLNLLAKNFITELSSPKEKRGGSRIKPQDKEITELIVEHIKQFKSKKIHTGRSYLHPGLSVTTMYTHWRNEMTKYNLPVSSFSKYYYIFTNKFNLGFGHPRQDECVCCFCTEEKNKIKNTTDESDKIELIENVDSHKQRSNIFHKIMNETNDTSINISFGMIQNQPLPKLNVTDAFYTRQVWLYNLTFVVNAENPSPKSCFMYTWLETQSGRGPNEVTSALLDFLEMIDTKFETQENPPTTINLYSDSCAAQNKNKFVMIALLHFINVKAKVIKKINHYFPVRGHSYTPSDQVFGRIEIDLKKKENIFSPGEYYDIFRKYTTVKVLGNDYTIMDYKSVTEKIVKKFQFKSTKQKVFSYSQGKKTVGISQTYKGNPVWVDVLKKQSDLLNIGLVNKLQMKNHVKQSKKDDVKKVMKYFTITPDAEQFYKDIFNNDVETSMLEEDYLEYDEDTN